MKRAARIARLILSFGHVDRVLIDRANEINAEARDPRTSPCRRRELLAEKILLFKRAGGAYVNGRFVLPKEVFECEKKTEKAERASKDVSIPEDFDA